MSADSRHCVLYVRKSTDRELCTIERFLKRFGVIVIDNNRTVEDAMEIILTKLHLPKNTYRR